MKKAFSVILSLVMLLTALPLAYVGSSAYDDWQFEYNFCSIDGMDFGDEEVICITKFEGYDTNLVIPSSLDGYRVVAVESCANSNLVTVTIPDTVFSLGNICYDCPSLQSVHIGSSVRYINYPPVSSCSSFTAYSVSSSNPYYTSVNGVLFTKDMTRLISYPQAKSESTYTIPAAVTEIGINAFFKNNNLTSVNIPGTVKTIREYAFRDCHGLTSVDIQNGVESLGKYAFENCSSLTSVKLPPTLVNYGDDIFYECPSSMAVHITDLKAWCELDFNEINNNPLYKGFNLYVNGSKLVNWTVPSNITSIGNYAFAGCTSLESVTMPDTVIGLGKRIFEKCANLKTAIFPDTVAQLGGDMFYQCDKLENVTLPSHLESLSGYFFDGCSSLKTVNIPYTVTSIGNKAFRDCPLLERVNIADNDITFGTDVFKNSNNVVFRIYTDNPENDSAVKAYARENNIPYTQEAFVLASPEYSWADDFSAATVTAKCANFPSYTYMKTVEPFVKITKNPTYLQEGEITYTAKFENDAFTDQVKKVKIPKLAYDELKTFPDVKKGDWFEDAVQYNAQKGFITGYQNGRFGPNDSLKRQDFVVMIARIKNANVSGYTSCPLPDVNINAYYGKSVAWAVDAGIISGYQNGKFGVGDNITREQIAVILYRFMGQPNVDSPEKILASYPDSKRVSSFATVAMAWAIKNGIISGKSGGNLAPVATASRAEIASIIMRMDIQGMFDRA